MRIEGACPCRSTRFEVTLTRELSDYSPRACDCDFCISRGARFLSDPEGKLTVSFSSVPVSLKQGSEQAEFLHCPLCKCLICVICSINGNLYGALNSSVSQIFGGLRDTIDVSPKRLSANEKMERWRNTWFPVDLQLPGT